MIDVCNSSSLIRLRPMLGHLASGWLVVLLLWPVGLAGQEIGQVTLYTPDGSQQRMLSTPLVVDVGLPSPMETPVSAVIGMGTGTRITDMEVVVSDSAGGQVTTSYAADRWRILSLAADASGHVWVGTWAGLSRFDGQQWTTFTTEDGLVDGEIYSLAVDGQGQVWAGSLNGLSRFDGQRWTSYWFEGMDGSRLTVAPNGDVWCAGYNNFLLARFDGQNWWTYNHTDIGIIESEEHFDNANPTNIAVDQSGTLWAVVWFEALRSAKRTDGSVSETWTRLLTFNGTHWSEYQLGVGRIFPDSQGRVWMSCVGGLCVKDGSMWKHYDLINSVQQMTEDAAGRLWIGKGGYFGVLEGTTWTGIPWKELRADTFAPLVIDSQGDLWIPSEDGLYRWSLSDIPTAIEFSSMPSEPRSFHLAQNYPNPFNHVTHISFTLQQSAIVSLQVFNTRGQLVATLVEGTRPAGAYQTAWDGRDTQGQAVSSGVYIVRLDAGGQQATRKMILVQ